MKKPDPEPLLSAWADEPRALTLEERAEVEALVERSPEHRREADEARALLARVRGLPAEGEEPAWDDFQRALRARLDEPQRGLVAWLRRWWKPVVGVGGLGLAVAAVLIVIVARRDPATTTEPPVAREVDAGAAPPPVQVAREVHDPDEPLALGAVGEVAAADLDDDVLDALDLDDDDDPEEGLVPDLDLGWIDQLDDDEVESVDAWLAQM